MNRKQAVLYSKQINKNLGLRRIAAECCLLFIEKAKTGRKGG